MILLCKIKLILPLHSVFNKAWNQKNKINLLILCLILQDKFIIFGGVQELISNMFQWFLVINTCKAKKQSFSKLIIQIIVSYMKLDQ